MQHGDAAVELGLHIGIAGGREGPLAELFVLLADCAACECRGDHAGGKQDSSRLLVHRKSPLVRERWFVSLRHDRDYRPGLLRIRCGRFASAQGAVCKMLASGERDTVSRRQLPRWAMADTS